MSAMGQLPRRGGKCSVTWGIDIGSILTSVSGGLGLLVSPAWRLTLIANVTTAPLRVCTVNRPVSRSAATITAQPRFRRICAGRGWNLEGRTSAARTYVPRTPAPGQHFIHSLHSFISPQNGSKNRIETGLN